MASTVRQSSTSIRSELLSNTQSTSTSIIGTTTKKTEITAESLIEFQRAVIIKQKKELEKHQDREKMFENYIIKNEAERAILQEDVKELKEKINSQNQEIDSIKKLQIKNGSGITVLKVITTVLMILVIVAMFI